MAAKVHHFQPPRDRLREDQAARLRDVLLPFESLWGAPVSEILGFIDEKTATRKRWTFVMLSPKQNRLVVEYISQNSARPFKAFHLWALCFEHLRQDTGEIMLSRAEIAERVGESPDNVSQIMSELIKFGAISRQAGSVGGRAGRGAVRYFMNPMVGTHLGGKQRDKAQAAAAQLRLV